MIKKIYKVLDRKQKREVLVLLFIILCNSLFELLGVSAILPLITAITKPDSIDKKWYLRIIREITGIERDESLIAILSFGLVIVYVFKNCFILWMNHALYKCVYQNQRRLSVRLMKCYMRQDYSFHVKHNVAELERNISDCTSFFTTIQYLLQLLIELLVCLLLIIFLVVVDIWTTLIIVAIMLFLLLLFVGVYRKKLNDLGQRNRELSAIKGKWFLQSLNGIKEIKATNREDFFLEKYDSTYRENCNILQKQVFLANMPKPVVEMICISSVLIFLAIRICMGSDINSFVPVLSVFAVAAFRMLPSFNKISGSLGSIMFNKPSVDAVYRDLMEINELDGNKCKEKKEENIGKTISFSTEIKLQDIEFSYPTKPDVKVLNKINITIPIKKSVALVGSSGSGKTTIADIIMGLYEPQKGIVSVDGVSIFDNIKTWHNMIGYIPQNIYLIDDTIRANIAFGVPEDEIDNERVWQVLDEAQLGDFIRQQKDGINSNIGDRGVKISGGQRQRIGIARALYNNPQLLILDEATSALDNETEEAVMDAIYRLSGKVTMVIIAHRLTTIKECDIIYEINNGIAKIKAYNDICK